MSIRGSYEAILKLFILSKISWNITTKCVSKRYAISYMRITSNGSYKKL